MSGTTIDSGLTTDSGLLSSISNPKSVNILGAYAGAADTANKMYGVQEAQAQRAWGEVLQAATNPQTGVVDYNKANALAAGRPDAAMGMMKGLKGSTELTGATQDQGIQRNKVMVDMMSSVLKLPDDQLHEGVVNNTRQLVASGAITQSQAELRLARLPNDPGQLRTMIEQQRMSLLPPGMQQPAIYGQPGSQTGPTGETIGTTTQVAGPNTGRVSPAQPSGTGVQGDTQWDQPFKFIDPTSGQERVTTMREYFRANNIPIPQIVAPAQGGAGGGSGVPPSLRNQNRPTSTTTAPTGAPGSGQPTSGVSGAAPDTAAKWKASTEQYTADTASAGQYQQRIFPLVQGRALLESGDVTTGKGAEYVQSLKGLLGTAAGQFGWNPNAINNAKFEELNKYLTQYTNSLPMAGGSDQRLASAITGNPSAHISTLANKDVMKALIGLERMKQTVVSDFANQGGQPRDYADYQRNWQNTHDPRAFIFDMLNDKERQQMVAGLKTDAERKAFGDTLTLVERNRGIMGQSALPH